MHYSAEKKRKKPKIRKITVQKRRGFPVKRTAALFICTFLLLCVLPFSFNADYNIYPQKKAALLKPDYDKLLYPASNMYKSALNDEQNIKDRRSSSSKPLMIDIPESYQRIGLRNSLLALAGKYKKIHPAVYVWEYSGKSYVNINADESFPAASIIKVPLLIELFRSIEKGRFSLYDTMLFEDYYRAEGSGRLKYKESGGFYTLDHLARIMIENSDNSSTNMIMSKIGGMPEVNLAMRSWGLNATGINAWLPDLKGTNVTTAREMAKMFYNIDITDIISNKSKRYMADYMFNVKNTRLLKAGLPKNAVILHKTGDIGYMLGDAGIVRAHNGKKYIVVILARRPYNSRQGKDFIVKASEIIYNNIAYN